MDLAQISQVDNALLQACLEGNEDALAHAVRLATRARDAMGATPLHMACLGGHLDIAAWCADQGLDVTTADAQGALPLHTACFNGHLDVARWLATKAKTSRKEALNQPGLQGGTPLHHAALGGSLKLCRWLLFHGADERATTVDGLTPGLAMGRAKGPESDSTGCRDAHSDGPTGRFSSRRRPGPTAADAAVDADELEPWPRPSARPRHRRDETARLLAEGRAAPAPEVAAASSWRRRSGGRARRPRPWPARRPAAAAPVPADRAEEERRAATTSTAAPAPASQEAAPSPSTSARRP